MEFDKKKLIKYLIPTFVIAWILQGVASWFALNSKSQVPIWQLIIAVSMFAPLVGALIANGDLKGMNWKPQIKGKVRFWAAAWFAPAILTALGAAIYFLIFPQQLDFSGEYIKAAAGEDALQQLEQQGLTYPMYVLVSVVSAITYAPVINIFVSLGEEVGWRGFLYPQLKAKFGVTVGRLIGGVIWGAWHWPLIVLIGYEYGTEYIGFPITGMLLFLVFTVTLGTICDWFYEKCDTIWAPALCHGTINAAAGIPVMVWSTQYASHSLLGPAPNGLIAGIPYLIFAVIIIMTPKKSALSVGNESE